MNSTCPHLMKYRDNEEKLIKQYTALLSHMVFPCENRRWFNKATALSCIDCETALSEGTSTRTDHKAMISGCFVCPTFKCIAHLAPHLRDSQHPYGISLETGHVYCFRCGDFVYDRCLEWHRMDVLNKSRLSLGLSVCASWNPSDEDLLRLASARCIDGGFTVRGLVNMGNTCFMNCVLQSLLHSPSLRDFFLSHQQHCLAHGSGGCLVCLMQDTFQHKVKNNFREMSVFFYNGSSRQSFVPSSILHTVWTRSHLSGYRQHDAHEFFMTALEMIHADTATHEANLAPGGSGGEKIPSHLDCKCVIDQLFTGQFQSDLKCLRCGNVSTKVEPCKDVSLNLPQGVRDLSLEKCLEGYISPEALHSTPCGHCSKGALEKQFLFLKTPVITVCHLKRFEHDTNLRKKMTTRVTFPERLDMSPYTTSFRNNPLKFDYSKGSTAHINRRSFQYTLFAVVQHEGSLDSGHYTAFVRSFNTWYLCDDERIRPVSLEKVLAAEAYILFYHATHIRFN